MLLERLRFDNGMSTFGPNEFSIGQFLKISRVKASLARAYQQREFFFPKQRDIVGIDNERTCSSILTTHSDLAAIKLFKDEHFVTD